MDIVLPALPQKFAELQPHFDELLKVVNGRLELSNFTSETVTVLPELDVAGNGVPLREVAVKHSLGVVPRAFATISAAAARIFEPRSTVNAAGEYLGGHSSEEVFFMFSGTWNQPVEVLLLPAEAL